MKTSEIKTNDWLDTANIEIPLGWKMSERIMDALDSVRNSVSRGELLKRIAEAIRVENAAGPAWYSQDVKENYLACIIEGSILIGS